MPSGEADHHTFALPGTAGDGPIIVDLLQPYGTSKGVALIAHGRNGAPDQPHMLPPLDACRARGLFVVAPRLGNSAVKGSVGAAGDFTMAGHFADVAVTLGWLRRSRSNALGNSPLTLIGHSMGAYAIARLAAETGAAEVAGLVVLSPVISGRRLIEARRRQGPEALAALAAELPGAMEEWPKHDLMPLAAQLAMPIGIVVGADDMITPPSDAHALARKLPNLIALDILPGEHHCPVGSAYARSVGKILDLILMEAKRP